MYSRFSLIFLLFFVLGIPATAQISGPYALGFGSSGSERMRDMCVDATGSYIMAFSYEQSVVFSGGTNPGQTLTSQGGQDSGLVRYDFLGNIQWALGWGNSGSDEYPVAIACAQDRSTYVAGRFTGTIDANPRAGESQLTSNGDADVYLIKFDPSGNFVWARSFGGVEEDTVAALALDREGNLLLTILYQGTLDADPSATVESLHHSAGGKDILFIKLNTAGNWIYSKSIGGTLDDGVDGVSTVFDGAGNLVIAGTFRGTADLDPSTAPADFTSTGGSDVFIARYTPSGGLFAARQMTSASDIQITSKSLGIDDSDNLFLIGSYRDTIDVDIGLGSTVYTARQGSTDLFVASYTRTDTLRWSFSLGSLGEERGRSLSVDRNGILTIGGSFQSSLDLDPGSGVSSILAKGSNGATDAFAAKFRASNGKFVWGFGFGGSLSGPTNTTAVVTTAIDTMGSVVIAGNFFGQSVDFDPSNETVGLGSAGGSDLFLAVYGWDSKLRKPAEEIQNPVLRASTNAASFIAGGVVPGSLYTLFGLNITSRLPGVKTPDKPITIPIPKKLCNTEIIFADPATLLEYKAPILYCSQFQINYQAPAALPINSFLTVKVVVDDVASNPLEILVKSSEIGIFMEDFSQRIGALVFAFGKRKGQKMNFANPVAPCDILEIYVTGLGQVSQGLPADGTPAGGVRPTLAEAKVVIYDDGTKGFTPTGPRFVELRKADGFIQYSGLTPQFVGLYQINMEWPNPSASTNPEPLKKLPLFAGNYPAYVEFNGQRSQIFILPILNSAALSPCIGGF